MKCSLFLIDIKEHAQRTQKTVKNATKKKRKQASSTMRANF